MSEQIVPQDFYVYVHRKATTGEIFYVGKGHGKRAWSMVRSSIWKRTVQKHDRTVEIVRAGLQEWAAFELESDLISLYGRRDLREGALVNLTDGGDGASGAVRTTEQRQRYSTSAKLAGASQSLRIKRANQARLSYADPIQKSKRIASLLKAYQDEAVKARHSNGVKNSHKTPGAKEIRSAAIRAAKSRPFLCVETGLIFEAHVDAAQWVEAKSGKNAGRRVIGAALRGTKKSAYGHTWRYATPEEIEAHKKGHPF